MYIETMDKRYYQYYDIVHSDKDYAREVETIIGFAKEVGREEGKKILDVGCGTGNHAFEFAKNGYSVVGIDTDCAIVEVADQKLKQRKNPETLKFLCQDVEELQDSDFDTAVSLFHVVNYIQEPDDLLRFFCAVNDRLLDKGLFVFDCWNGIAALIDNPKEKKKSLERDGQVLEISMTPEVNLMEQQVVIQNSVQVSLAGEGKERFTFEYVQRLWTPWQLKKTVESCNFKILKITSWEKPKAEAKYNNWKIVFVCQKK